MKKYIESQDLPRAKMAVDNINDKMKSVSKEIKEVERPNKRYLMEKLELVQWDVNVLIRMCEKGEENEKSVE